MIVAHDVPHVDALGARDVEHLIAVSIRADGGDERHARAEPGRGNRLIQPLSARRDEKGVDRRGRIRRWQSRRSRHPIHPRTADHDNVD